MNILCIGTTFLILIGIALLFHVVVKVSPEESFASTIMTVLLGIYITGLIGNTFNAFILAALLSVMGFLCAIYSQFKKSERRFSTFFTPSIVMIIGMFVFAVVVFHGMQICNWDELYQWGKAANYMVEYDKLPNGSDFTGESVLLSSTTFFHYFMAKLSYIVKGSITESNYYVSNLLLWFSAVILPFSGEGWKEWKRIFSFGIFQFLMVAILFAQPYYNIYTDEPTAFWAGGMIAWLLLDKCRGRNIYLVPLVLVNVGLMKSMVGPLFAVIVILSAIVVYIMKHREKQEPILPDGWKRKIFSKKGFFVFAAVLSPFILMGVWSVIIGNNGIFRFNGGLNHFDEKNRLALTVKAMIGWIFKSLNLREEGLFVSYGLFILLAILIVYVLYPLVLNEKWEKRFKGLMRIYLIGFVLYFLVMLFAYMTVFEYNDSINGTSLNRYYSDYILLGMVPLMYPFFQERGEEKSVNATFIKKGFVILCSMYVFFGTSHYFLPQLAHAYAVDEELYSERENFKRYAKEIKEITDESGKIYFINQKMTGLYTLVADYELGDQLSRGGMCFKFREDASQQINGLTDYDISTLPEVLASQGYEYVWVYSKDNYLKENMKNIFDINVKKGGFYKVMVDEGGVWLSYVKRIK